MTQTLTRPSAAAAPDAPTVIPHWAAPADDATVQRTADALRAHNFDVHVAQNRDEARDIVLSLIPEGAEVHQGASVTLEEIGVTRELESGRYNAVRPRLWGMDRKTQAKEMRKLGAAPDYMLGSVVAVTQDGSVVVASNSGSQLGAYASGAGRVIWIIGSQKIVRDLPEAFRRLEEHSFPLEDARAQAAYGMKSAINKVLITYGELQRGRTSIVLIKEPIGF